MIDKNNKHVFVEKSLALDITHAEELVQLAQLHGVELMVGNFIEYHITIDELKKLFIPTSLSNLIVGTLLLGASTQNNKREC